MALLGEMDIVKGSTSVNGRISYVPQEAWVFSASLRENIIVGQELDVNRYKMAIEAAALVRVCFYILV